MWGGHAEAVSRFIKKFFLNKHTHTQPHTHTHIIRVGEHTRMKYNKRACADPLRSGRERGIAPNEFIFPDRERRERERKRAPEVKYIVTNVVSVFHGVSALNESSKC